MLRNLIVKIQSAPQFYFRLYPGGWLVLALALGAASVLCYFLRKIALSDVYVPMIFVLAVLVVSLCTDGFFYGILAAAVSVLGVNYAFTFPYMKLDFSIYGYPLTFLTMLAVGVAVSALTTRLKAQERLRTESEKEKIRANLLRAISHDLRTPLTAISGSIAAVLDEDTTLTREQQRSLLLDARHDADWLCRMVENILSITRIGDGNDSSITLSDEVLEEVLGEAVQTFRKRRSDIAVSVTVPEEVVILPMDAMLIEQVLLNLMDNAAIHGRTTTRIQITAAPVKNGVAIAVRDDGQGIDPAILPRLFDGHLPSSARGVVDNTRSMGIGLSVCRTIAEAHNGSITAENDPGGGAVFTLTLPIEEGL